MKIFQKEECFIAESSLAGEKKLFRSMQSFFSTNFGTIFENKFEIGCIFFKNNLFKNTNQVTSTFLKGWGKVMFSQVCVLSGGYLSPGQEVPHQPGQD